MSDRRLRNRLSRVSAPRLWVGIGLSGLATYLSVRGVQWGELAKALLQSDWLVLLLALGTVLLNTWMKAVRWRLLFYPLHSGLPVRAYLSALLVGQLGNKLLPARLGDLARIYMIGERTGIGRAHALATTIMEKAIDSVLLLALIALLSLRMPMPLWLARSSVLASSLLAALLFAMILLAGRDWKIAELLQGWAESHAPPIVFQAFGRLVQAGHSLGALSDPSVQMQVWMWSFLIWLTAGATNVLASWAVGLGANVLPSLVLLVVLMTGAALPTSPLQLGVFHYLCVLTLTLFGVEHSMALSYALVLHLAVHLPIVVGGALGLWVGQLDLKELGADLATQGG